LHNSSEGLIVSQYFVMWVYFHWFVICCLHHLSVVRCGRGLNVVHISA